MGRAGDWCILRTSGPQTLRLAASLRAAGIDAWTPMMVISRKRPRSRIRVERDAPILPTFVFARADRMSDLLVLLTQPSCAHPAFSIFRHAGRYPLVEDGQIADLRKEEADCGRRQADAKEKERLAKLKASRPVFAVGETVQVPQTAFASMTGIVEGRKGRCAIVNFGGGITMTIGAWLLAAG